MQKLVKALLILAIFLVPALAHAQATVAGVVRDTSGAVLPGVTVEAASPVLIERVRSATTDGNGQYQIVDLRPGLYEVTYTLSGFATVKREAIEVTGAGVITINVELRVGAVTETINVTGQTPIVDVQSTRHQAVLDTQTINDLPAARSYGAILAAVPTLQGGGANSSASQNPSFFSVHGGPANEGRVQLDGLSVGAAFNGGGVSGNAYDIANAQEMQIILAGALGENETGGPVMNLVPKTGGNTFQGSIFASGAGDWAQGDNLDAALMAQGVTSAGLIKLWDVSFAMGGPIKRDRLWFFANIRDEGQHEEIPGLFGNANAGNAARWDYVEDRSVQARTASAKTITSVRLTAQATPRNKFSFYYDYQWDCDQSSQSLTEGCRPRGEDWTTGSIFGSGFSPEAVSNYWDGREIISQVTWSSPVTNKLLLEAGYATFLSHWGWMKQPGAITDLVQVTQLAPFFKVYRAVDNMLDNNQNPNTWRASATYATGAHSLKFGYQGAYHVENTMDLASDPQMTITDLSPIVGVPGFGQATIRIAPWLQSNRTTYHAVYAQDQWTVGRFTLQGALRFDRAWSFFPADGNGAPQASRWNAAPISFPKSDGVTGYNDITPRAGVAWDMFGTGKTSLRVNVGKYLQSANNQENYTISNPALDGRNGRRGPNFQTTASRLFIDFNQNHLPDCDMLNPGPNGECIAPDLGNFANPNALTLVNPEVLSGWGVRPYDWQFGLAVQQEVVARTSVEVGYHRRWFRNFFLFDNINLSASDFDLVTITAPNDPRLPNGGGYPASYYIPKPGVNTANIQNRYTFATDYGDWTNYWHGVDAVVNARLQNGLVLQAGTSTGRAVTDNCQVVAEVPELLNPALTNPSAFPPPATQLASSCHKVESWQTQFRGLASYTIPRIDVLVSTIFRSQPNATFGFGATPEGNSTGLSANYATVVNGQAVNLNLLEPGVHYADRINVLDARFSKILRFGNTRTSVGVDFLNIFNANTGTMFQLNYGATYLTPTAILNPRLARLNVTFDF
ncbi:MAG TPA: carboxypeptidase regulatory-like domain-containing protein [Vicinamibacterales bacterium]